MVRLFVLSVWVWLNLGAEVTLLHCGFSCAFKGT